MSILQVPATNDLLLLYPGDSLIAQIGRWIHGCPSRLVGASFERSLPELRRLLQRADSALIDATGDPALAADAALQAIGRLGRRSVAVYSDVAHEELERFVRAQGACFVLGPLDERLWAEFFERFLGRSRSAASIVDTATPQLPVALWLDRATRLQQWFAQRFGENSDRSIGGHD